uniref:Predicted protein n=1 Tax=Hordeum vulgare subsp. vulgare TaxID=112509 RepID=F2DVK0_HORVV|nr:predicted protein [Hordeum vulgare subsp. vulgare]
MQIHGNAPRTVYARLNDHAKQNDTVITVDSLVGWKVGDSIAISPTTFPKTSQSDFRTIVSIDAAKNQVTLNQGLSFARWGKLQYMTDQGIKLTPGVFKEMRAHPSVPEVLDERAVIVHLTRNIVIEAPNDTDWEAGHGVHFMWQGQSKVQLNGVEFRRCGQAGAIGRYAIHAHMQSYNMPDGFAWPEVSDGKFIGDANETVVRNVAIYDSKNRAIAIHGTCGARYVNNVAFNILGHAFFFEDGSEIRNHFIGNVALKIRPPTAENRLLRVDEKSSGIWFTNGNNHLRDNIIGDITGSGFGIWNAIGQGRAYMNYENIVTPNGVTFTPNLCGRSIFTCGWDGKNLPRARESWVLTALNSTTWSVKGDISGTMPDAIAGQDYGNTTGSGSVIFFKIEGASTVGSQITFKINASGYGCLGQSKWVELWPGYTPMIDYVNNTAFSSEAQGAQSASFAGDDFGTEVGGSIASMKDHRPNSPWDPDYRVPTVFRGTRLWMNQEGAYQNVMINPEYPEWILADNRGTDLSGSVQFGLVSNALFVGNSLNNLETSLYASDRHAMASYHFALSFHNLTFYNYPPLPPAITHTQRALVAVPGLMESWDLYLNPIEMGPATSQYGILGIYNWRKFNVSQFERCPPPNLEYIYNSTNYQGPDLPLFNGWQSRYWTHSGALYDKEGQLAGVKGEYLTFNVPYVTYNLTNKRIIGRQDVSTTIGTTDKMGGVVVEAADNYGRWDFYATLNCQRLDENWKTVGNWTVKDGTNSWILGGMRHCGVVRGGRYKFSHDDKIWRRRFHIAITNLNEIGDDATFGIQWAGDVQPVVYYNNVPLNSTFAVTSMSALASTKPSYYVDSSNNLVWVHHSGERMWDGSSLIAVVAPV